MRLHESTEGRSIETAAYRLHVGDGRPTARLEDDAGEAWAELRLLASVDTLEGPDETVSSNGPEVRTRDGRIELAWRLGSSRWTDKRLVVTCTEDDVAVHVEVEGSGRPTDITVLGGRVGLPRLPAGSFGSGARFATLFSPAPNYPSRIVQPAGEPSDISASGGAEGRRGWFFTPGPLCYAVSRARVPDASMVPDGPWLTFGLAAAPEEQQFLGFGYRASEHGFHFLLDYEGHTELGGRWVSPRIVIAPAADPYAGIVAYRRRLEADDLVPGATVVTSTGPHWWREPIFSGWGAQSALAYEQGLTHAAAPTFATQERYDAFLDHLEARGVVPATIVVDDKWQERYGTNEPDTDKWPDLRGWIAARHARGQRVLLWWKAWDPEGLPAEQCIRAADGTAIAVDPNEPSARETIRAGVRRILSADGLDADGLKIDFTAQTPSGASLRHRGGAWGIALLRRLLATVHDEAKRVKPDCLLIGHAPEPSIAPLLDMIRLNDMLRLDDPQPRVPILAQMCYRAAVVRAACPGHLIDTDDWCPPDLANWRAYAELKPRLGVPALYYASRLDLSGERLEESDYELLRRTWAEYRHRQGLPARAASV